MKLLTNYYLSSFFWSTFQKIVTAIVGFVSVPLLLGYYGKADYGILGIATACNGYMHLLDLGMNIGAVKFFSQWRTEGKTELINRVARTNITFYGIISFINIFLLLLLAIWGELLFSVTHEQFLQLRTCLFIIAFFCVFSWASTTFNQLLVAYMQIAYTMKIQSIIALIKGILVGAVLLFDLKLTCYFFFLTGVGAALIIPYVIKCNQLDIIDCLKPAVYWKDFKVVIGFSLSIFALSLFQMTATQSRPIVLSIFAIDGTDAVAEFKIIEVVPQLIITIGGTFSGIFLPKTSEMVSQNNQNRMNLFAYKWTVLTSIIACVLCFPFIIGGKEFLTAYVGSKYTYLYLWLVIWVICMLLQIHSTPANALILAKGKTRLLVQISAVSCIISIIINALLSKKIGVGSAVIGYSIYIIIVLMGNYFLFYRKFLGLDELQIIKSFVLPVIASLSALIILYIFIFNDVYNINIFGNERLNNLSIFGAKAFSWLIVFVFFLFVFRIVTFNRRKLLTFIEINYEKNSK